MPNTITAANSIYTLVIANLFPQGQTLQGFATDEAFTTNAVKPVETMMGVDGNMSAGWVPVETVQTIAIQADSNSALIFDAWDAAQQAAREVYWASAVIILPGNGSKFTLTKGVLSSVPRIPAIRKVMQSRTFEITWQTVIRTPA